MTRSEANQKILLRLFKLIEKYPDIRFGQLLFNYVLEYESDPERGIRIKDCFNEESTITLDRINKNISYYNLL